MSGSITAEEGALIGMCLEALFYGIYIVTVGYSMRILLYHPGPRLARKSRREIRWWIVCVVVAMAVVLTGDIVLVLRSNLVTFAPNAASSNQTWISVVRDVNYTAIAIVADAVLLYRLFRLHEQNYLLVALPFLMWVAGIVCSSVLISQGIATSVLSEQALRALEFTTFGLVAAINAFATSMITAKLWRARKRVSTISTDPDRWLLVGRVVLDSGAMYTVASLLVLGTLPMINLSNCISDATTPVVGIAFNLLIIRLDGIMRGPTQSADSANWRNSCPTGIDRRTRISGHPESAIPLSAFGISASPDFPGDKATIDL